MKHGPVEHLVIVGGGTAGWMAAAAIGKVFKGSVRVTLVESSSIGTVGVGEATIPDIINFNRAIGVNEKAFLAFTKGTFKLGIQFKDWGGEGESYFHPFGRYGTPIGSAPFFQYWQKWQKKSGKTDLASLSLNTSACLKNKFSLPSNIPNSPLAEMGYAYHFDAALYAQFLKNIALQHNVTCLDAVVNTVRIDETSGYIQSIGLANGEELVGDFFIDCTGFRGLLIEQALHTGYDDWSHLLPCNSAVTVATPALDPLPPYTLSQAREAGWQWRIPLQHRTGNGYVYCDKFVSDAEAEETLLGSLPGEPLGDVKCIKFTTGMRRKLWNKNCLALGLSSGFLEPLESTSIHLIYESIANFLGLFPSKVMEDAVVNKFNELQVKNFNNVRDILIFHYWFNRRSGPFWSHCRRIEIPERLLKKVELYRSSGRIFREDNELFNDNSWLSVFEGQGLECLNYNPVVDTMPNSVLARHMEGVQQVIQNSCDTLPSHKAFLERYLR